MGQHLYRIHWEDTGRKADEDILAFLQPFTDDSGTFTLDIDDLKKALDEEIEWQKQFGKENACYDPSVMELIEWLKTDLADGERHSYAIG